MSGRRANLKRKSADLAELKAKRAKGETNLSDNLKWAYVGEVVKNVCPLLTLTSSTLSGCKQAVGFDIDFTVIKTASGRKFASGANDWEFLDDCVPDKLRELNKNGYRVIFFTNQAGIEKLKVKPEEIQQKIEAIITDLGIPVLAFVCTGENHYRKPSTLMWEYWESKCNNGVPVSISVAACLCILKRDSWGIFTVGGSTNYGEDIVHEASLYNAVFGVDRSKCMYVGDAAGRAKNWAPDKPKDFSCSDRKFAANLGIKFATPEEFFLGEQPAKFEWGSVNPTEYLSKTAAVKKEYHSKVQEIVILVGPPASGKSTFRKQYFESKGYVTINRDTMGTMPKCLKAAAEALKKGESIVIDNTNPSVDARKEFINLAQKNAVPCRCFVMNTPLELAHHLNYVRQIQTKGAVRRIPDVGYNVYKKNFQPPTKAEQFSEVIQIDFVPQFQNKADEELFKQWT